ncbi:hypothetical protein EH223_19040 [candidate division KSB1 bacterium]|nr:hypothetical protein [candidate division KSB1 bacterium]RQW00293.1 MAG: hypothetical protein EH223_19040 [candidate division KSB1 bacterium]
MSKILFTGKDQDYFRACASRLRWRGYQVVINEDVMDGLREVSVFGVNCIVWDVEKHDLRRTYKFNAIKRYHRHTPLFIIDHTKEPYQHGWDRNTYLIENYPTVQEIVNQIMSLVGNPEVFSSDTDQEKELEVMD